MGLLKEELRRLDSLILRCADATRVPAGGALAVDRHGFARMVTEAIRSHPNITIIDGEVTDIPEGEVLVATGPLTSDAFAETLLKLLGRENTTLSFFDAAARPAHNVGLVFHPVVKQKILQRAACFLRAAGQHGEIGLLHAALAHALGEARGLLRRLCIDHHAADRLIEPVDGVDLAAQLRGKQLRQCLRIHPLRRNAHGLDADNGGFCFLQNFDHSCPLTFLPF